MGNFDHKYYSTIIQPSLKSDPPYLSLSDANLREARRRSLDVRGEAVELIQGEVGGEFFSLDFWLLLLSRGDPSLGDLRGMRQSASYPSRALRRRGSRRITISSLSLNIR